MSRLHADNLPDSSRSQHRGKHRQRPTSSLSASASDNCFTRKPAPLNRGDDERPKRVGYYDSSASESD
jgi:hypothetical protein